MPINRRGARIAASSLSLLGAFALLLALFGSAGPAALAQDDEDEPEPIAVELIGAEVPNGIEGRELALRKITFQPGAVLPAHSHPGALILTVVAGELTYTLFEGEAEIRRAPVDGEAGELEPLVVDEPAILEVGDSLFEEDVLHEARNDGDEPTVVWVSSLLAQGEDFVHVPEDAAGADEAEDGDDAEADDTDAGEDDAEEPADGTDDAAGDGSVVTVRLDEFDIRLPEDVTAGETTFEITNTGTVAHDFAVSGEGVEAQLDEPVGPGETATLTVDLPAGEYEIICPLANHAELGMTRNLTVVEAEGEAPADADEAEPEDLTISIVDFAFDPAEVEIEAGTIVTWVNDDAAPHTVTSDDDAFDSGTLEPGDSFSFTFEEAGTFAYHCDIHPRMTATVEVT